MSDINMFEVDGKKYAAVNKYGCNGCAFAGARSTCRAIGDNRIPKCSDEHLINVIFVEVNNNDK